MSFLLYIFWLLSCIFHRDSIVRLIETFNCWCLQLFARSQRTLDPALTTQFSGTSIRRTATAVDSGTAAVKAIATDFRHERSVKVSASRHQALVRIVSSATH